MSQIINLGNSGIQFADSGGMDVSLGGPGIRMWMPSESGGLVAYNLVLGDDTLVLGSDNLTLHTAIPGVSDIPSGYGLLTLDDGIITSNGELITSDGELIYA